MRELVYLITAVVGVVGSLGMAFNTMAIVVIAAFNKGKISLDLNRFHELWFEVPVAIVIFGLGVWGAVYMLHQLLK
jgi:uncharacterized integral membrane protein